MSLIKVQNGDYYDKESLRDVMGYCQRKCDWWSGSGVRTDSLEEAVADMERAKALSFKTDGKQLYHMEIYISRATLGCIGEKYNKNRYDDEVCSYLIASEISEILFDKGFQNTVYMHSKTDDVHLHLAINSVNYKTKAKLTNVVGLSNELYHYLKREYRFLRFDGPYFV